MDAVFDAFCTLGKGKNPLQLRAQGGAPFAKSAPRSGSRQKLVEGLHNFSA
jgi:hypothetical protein